MSVKQYVVNCEILGHKRDRELEKPRCTEYSVYENDCGFRFWNFSCVFFVNVFARTEISVLPSDFMACDILYLSMAYKQIHVICINRCFLAE